MNAVMEDIAMTLVQDQDYLTRKLAHYNQWLLDPKRPVGVPYAGFPEDVKQAKAVAKLKAEAAAKAEKAAAKVVAKAKAPAKVKRARKTEGPTKQDQAVELYRELNGDKATVISAIQERLGMSLAGATTYFYNAKKLA